MRSHMTLQKPKKNTSKGNAVMKESAGSLKVAIFIIHFYLKFCLACFNPFYTWAFRRSKKNEQNLIASFITFASFNATFVKNYAADSFTDKAKDFRLVAKFCIERVLDVIMLLLSISDVCLTETLYRRLIDTQDNIVEVALNKLFGSRGTDNLFQNIWSGGTILGWTKLFVTGLLIWLVNLNLHNPLFWLKNRTSRKGKFGI